jgi:hypothetical protein
VNRYVAAGIATDAQDGRRVLIVAHTRLAARDAFNQIARVTHGAERIVRANGNEAVHHRNGGSVHLTTPRSAIGVRGLTVDIIYLDSGVDRDHELITDLLPLIAASPDGELIRA